MIVSHLEGRERVTAVASAVGFAVLASVLAALGAVGRDEAVMASAAVALAFGPSGWWSGGRGGRRMAEALLVPAAFAFTMMGSASMRRMVVPPLLLLAAWGAVAGAWRRTPENRRPILAACFGVSARAAVGLGLIGYGAPHIAFVFVLSAVLPWAVARRWGQRPAEIAALVTAVIPWQRWPIAAAGVAVVLLAWGVRSGGRERGQFVLGWLPGIGAAVLLASSLAPWPGGTTAHVPAFHSWPVWVGIGVVLLVTSRLRPGPAGALWFAATFLLGSALLPTPEHRAFSLSTELGTFHAPAGTGQSYVIEFEVRGPARVDSGTPLAVATYAGEAHTLTTDSASVVVWRPRGGVGKTAKWRSASRYIFEVPAGERPELIRHPDLDADVVVRIVTIGPARPTPPRSLNLSRWMLGAALVVALLQVLAATWRGPLSAVPWMVLVLGALAARAPVEPLHLVSERLAPDLALAAVMLAWLPAARVWLKRRRYFVATTALLVPLAMATPQLTPPMYGDEPFHLMLMESLTEDRDLNVSDDLDLEHHPQNALYAPGWPLFHSPGLGLLLLPGFVLAGRTGALVVLALMGGFLAHLVARRARELGVGEDRIRLAMLATAATYPLATFATQIWPELPGALAVAALLVLSGKKSGGRLRAAVVTVGAAVVKTRLALLTFPVMAAVWLRRNRLSGAVLLAVSAAAVMAAGWLVMGHPFGPYRRLHHLWPSDPGLAGKVVGGLMFDAAGGLLFTAPLLLVAAVGAVTLWRRGGTGERALLVGCGLTVAALLHSPEWYGGGAPPARYLVAMLPAFVLAGSMVLQRPSRWRRLTVILLPPSVVAWWVLITRPHFSVNPGDGGYWLADALARRFAADARDFFPSFLVPTTATWAVPIAIIAVVGLAVWISVRHPFAGAVLRQSWVAVWLVAAAGLVLAISVVPDKVVDFEAPQVRRSGGNPVPPEGTVSRYSHRRGWRLGDGNRVVMPLRLKTDSEVVLEGWLEGAARRRAEIHVRWDEGEMTVLRWQGDEPPEKVVLPPPPGAGRHRLTLGLVCPPGGGLVLDRLLAKSADGRAGIGGVS